MATPGPQTPGAHSGKSSSEQYALYLDMVRVPLLGFYFVGSCCRRTLGKRLLKLHDKIILNGAEGGAGERQGLAV